MKTGLIIGSAITAMLLATTVVLAAGDANKGQEKAALCAGCHGATGTSVSPQIPNLAGQKEAYLVKALNDFRTGKRTNPIMASMAQSLNDEDVANLAAFFSTQKPSSD